MLECFKNGVQVECRTFDHVMHFLSSTTGLSQQDTAGVLLALIFLLGIVMVVWTIIKFVFKIGR